MTNPVFPGRYTAQTDEPFVVFLIGMRVNNFWAFRKWMPVARAMPPMMDVLYRHPEKGFLGAETFFRFWPPVSMMMTYWRSFDDLERFARSKDDPHADAWRRFNQAIGDDGSVGIWHETYMVEPGRYEAVYGNMTVFGLAAASKHIPITGRHHTAHGRVSEKEAQPLQDA